MTEIELRECKPWREVANLPAGNDFVRVFCITNDEFEKQSTPTNSRHCFNGML